MNQMRIGLAMLAATAVLTGCGGAGTNSSVDAMDGTRQDPPKSAAAVEKAVKALQTGKAAEVVEAGRDFGFRLFAETLGEDGNVCISPLSVWIALSMTYNGADGETREAMEKTFGTSGIDLAALNETNAQLHARLDDDSPAVQIRIANSLWARQGVRFEEAFLQRNRRVYNARVEALDFASPEATDTINAWVSKATNDRIPTIVDEIPSDMVLYLINAVHFDGRWSEPFRKERTEDKPFHLEAGGTKQVPMMSRIGRYAYFAADGVEAVSLPYGKGQFDMVVVLPPKGAPIREFAREIDLADWKTWTEGLSAQEVNLGLPRFKQEYKTGLERALKALGMGIAFDPGRADFGGMRPERDLFISSVVHKTFIEVDEEGTEAAAATSVGVAVTSMPAEPVRFVADRPFLYAIRDTRTGALLFLGLVQEP
jgi:serine protease inhibitor